MDWRIANFLRISACGGLVVAGCGKPAAVLDAPGVVEDSAAGPGGPGGPGGPDDAPGVPSDSHMIDARVVDARVVDARMVDARMVDAPLLDGPRGTPRFGAHAMAFYHLAASNATSIATPAMTTQASGSMIVVSVGRGDNTLFALPTDSKGNTPYRQRDVMHPYAHPFESSGTALYEFPSAIGGNGFQVINSTGPTHTSGQNDEITVAAVEVIGGTQIQQVWNVVIQQSPAIPVTSGSITTTGPATLIAFWWGDASPSTPQTATPNNGFTVVDTNLQEIGSFVQCAVAVKNVTTAGTYNVTWTSTPVQGAQLWLVAVQ